MLTPEQIATARQKIGYTAPPTAAETAADPASRVAALDAAWEPTNKKNAETAAIVKEPFKTPLTRIASGKESENVDVAKGAVKQALNDFASAGAQEAGPVGADMKSRAGKFFDPLKDVTTPKNAAQKEGAMNTTMAEIVAPIPPIAGKAKQVVNSVKSSIRGVDPAVVATIDRHLQSTQQIIDSGVQSSPELISRLKTNIVDGLKAEGKASEASKIEKLSGEFSDPNKFVDAAKKIITPTGEEKKLTDALTPLLTPMRKLKGIVASAKSGEVFDAALSKQVQQSVTAVQDVASALGKKPTDFVKTGVKKAQDNAAGLGKAIGEYSKKIVTPFLQKSGVNYNYVDLKKALELVHPSESLDRTALAAYNKVRERVLSAIANKVGPEVKNIRSVAAMRDITQGGEVPAKTLKGDVDFWDARKIIDTIVDEETKGKAFGDASLAGAKAAYKDMRTGFAQYLAEAFRYPGQMENVNKANEFLKSERVAKMDKTGWNLDQFEHQFGLTRNASGEAQAAEWEKYMQNMSSLYDGIANVGVKATKEYGNGKIVLWMKEHPAMAEMMKNAVYFGGAGSLIGIGMKAIGA